MDAQRYSEFYALHVERKIRLVVWGFANHEGPQAESTEASFRDPVLEFRKGRAAAHDVDPGKWDEALGMALGECAYGLVGDEGRPACGPLVESRYQRAPDASRVEL